MAATSDVEINRKALLVPAAAPFYETLAPYAYTLIRVALGLILVPHGFAKLFLGDAVPASRNFVNFGWAYPLAWAYLIGALEFFGGLLLAVGLFTRIIAAAFVIEMAVISFAVLYPNWSWGKHGMEYALFMGIIALAVFLRGGGRYSLDSMIGPGVLDFARSRPILALPRAERLLLELQVRGLTTSRNLVMSLSMMFLNSSGVAPPGLTAIALSFSDTP